MKYWFEYVLATGIIVGFGGLFFLDAKAQSRPHVELPDPATGKPVLPRPPGYKIKLYSGGFVMYTWYTKKKPQVWEGPRVEFDETCIAGSVVIEPDWNRKPD